MAEIADYYLKLKKAIMENAPSVHKIGTARNVLNSAMDHLYRDAFKEVKEEHIILAIREHEADTIGVATKLAEDKARQILGRNDW